jgi:hypothetical protein
MIRRRVMAAAGPPLEVLDFLLRCTRTIASVDRLHAAGREYDPFSEFTLDMMSTDNFRALWHRHEAAIVAEAKRRGLEVPDPAGYKPYPTGCWIRRVWDGD